LSFTSIFELIIQLLTPLLVFALICVLIFETRRTRAEKEQTFKQLLEVMREMSDKLATGVAGGSPGGTAGTGMAAISSGRLEATAQKLEEIVEGALQEIAERQRENLALVTRQHEGFNEFLDGLSRQQAALEKLVKSIQAGPPAQMTQPAERAMAQPVEDVIDFSPSIESAGAPRPPTPPAARNAVSSNSKERFENLSRWLHSNMQSVMQRSLDARSQPEILLTGAPSELKPTVQIADGMVLLVGTRDYAEKLALVLPGSYIGSRYYNWFEIPKGTNERVEETVEPAIVKQVADDFVVIRRGSVRQN
jgi:hypothetical protein